MKKGWLVSILMISTILFGCQNGEKQNASEKISVVTSFYPMYEFTRQVAGDQADVTLMLSSGEDAHHYEPSAKDVARVNKADVFVYSSEEMEYWVDSLLETINNDKLIVARAADGIEPDHHHKQNTVDNDATNTVAENVSEEEREHSHEDGEQTSQTKQVELKGLSDHYHTGDVVTLAAELQGETNYDHWHWYSRDDHNDEWELVTGQETDLFEYKTTGKSFEVKAVLLDDEDNTYAESESVSVLIDNHENQDPHSWLDPVLAQEQVNIIRDSLIEADPNGKDIYEQNAESFKKELQKLDEEYQETLKNAKKRIFVVQHQAFGYLAERYNLEQISIGGISTEVEPSASRIAEIGNLVKVYNVPVIYYQQGANSAIAETVAAETGTKTAKLYDLEVLSKEFEDEKLGYIAAMRENLKSLQLSIQ
ncbi:Mn2+/Zn2+ ABC transporter substrate-binding protein [Niallia circulans]|uniref:Mn2+/Zn2+ ABC transporter substrate-binding protein n=1 Tax=Niallia circulans TaxID=1397 RepID=A0A553SRL4_NIACI|nr:zinc ABC transporter substrate-binding protein [Niallia circulans]TRZ39611.1 Mn2+/Zn2+ ABC transporter substrate-binding protein [Niallia circulans]